MEKLTQDAIDKDLQVARQIHGNKFHYELKKGTRVDLRTLAKNQQICASKIKGHHVLMTEKV